MNPTKCLIGIKKLACLILFQTCSLSLLFSASLDANKAKDIARQFFSSKHGLTTSQLPIIKRVQIASPDTDHEHTVQNAPYYIYNFGYNNGFVLVAGDDLIQPILGYSDSGSFPETDIPTHVQALLDSYQETIEYITTQADFTPLTEQDVNPTRSISTLAGGIPIKTPLLGDLRWGQGAPFNLLTPYDDTQQAQTPAGCVAVAMSQIMKYHTWPNVGIGQKTYTSKYGDLSVNFSNTTYRWDEMIPDYDMSSASNQDTAVAILIYHTGVAVEMDYGPSGSGAYNLEACYALKNHFNYDPDLQLLNRKLYTHTEWQNLLENELNANRPVYYAASSGESGHAFVCDGYDSNGFYHINWGWGGFYNGYFELMTLSETNPETTGYTGGFSANHQMIVGIQKPDGIHNPNPQVGVVSAITSSNTSVRTSNPTTYLSCQIGNYGCNNFSGYVGFGFVKEGENNIQVLTSYLVSSLPEKNLIYFQRQVSLSAMNTDGNYTIYPIFKSSDANTWSIIKGSNLMDNRLIAIRSNKTIGIQPPSNALSLMVVDSIYPRALMRNKVNEVSLTIINEGIEYHSYISLQLFTASGETLLQPLTTTDILLPPNHKKTFHFNVTPTLTNDVYTLRVLYDKSNNFNLSGLTSMTEQVDSNQIRIISGENEPTSVSTAPSIYCSRIGQRLWIQTFYPIQKMELYDAKGSMIQQVSKQNWIDVSESNKGIYMLRIWTNGKMLVEKIQI